MERRLRVVKVDYEANEKLVEAIDDYIAFGHDRTQTVEKFMINTVLSPEETVDLIDYMLTK